MAIIAASYGRRGGRPPRRRSGTERDSLPIVRLFRVRTVVIGTDSSDCSTATTWSMHLQEIDTLLPSVGKYGDLSRHTPDRRTMHPSREGVFAFGACPLRLDGWHGTGITNRKAVENRRRYG